MVLKLDNKDKNGKSEIFEWIKTIGLALIIAYIITHYIIINAVVPSDSMETTIMTGDRLITNRLAYTFKDPERGDIIVFPYPDDEDVLFVKRVIGLPGETVTIEDGNVYIDGELLEEDYVSSDIIDKTRNSGPYVVPEDSVFVMGDNRLMSKDSRYWENKYVSEDKILGKVLFRYFPLPKIVK